MFGLTLSYFLFSVSLYVYVNEVFIYVFLRHGHMEKLNISD